MKPGNKENNPSKHFFGFKKVTADRKHSMVQQVFSSVANKYDLMNNLMSFGIQNWWKKQMLQYIPHAEKLLDVAGGTGDIARLFYKREKEAGYSPQVTLCDFNVAMLQQGRNKMIDHGIAHDVTYICGDATHLPFADNEFDCYTISFGIRNVVDIKSALKEAYRVLKPGGKFICLEFSKVENQLMSGLYDLYSFNVIPKLGELVAKDRESYQYLVESIRKFPTQLQFLQMILDTGFVKSSYRNLSGGITAIHYGYKP